MPPREPLVSICLPVRNGEETLADVAASVLAQDHGAIELVITDNASTDGTEALCRTLAASDSRVVYHRQERNIGLVNNFISGMRLARGTFVRWIGDDDWLDPTYLSRCLELFAADERLILVTTQMAYVTRDGTEETAAYHETALSSADPVDRFAEMLRLLNESHLLLDPLYGLMRREQVLAIPRRTMLREDEIFAARLALAGPWGHLPVVLARRHRDHLRATRIARRLDVPGWHAYAERVLECRELMRCVQSAPLDPAQRRRAVAAIGRMYVRNRAQVAARRTRRVAAAVRLVR